MAKSNMTKSSVPKLNAKKLLDWYDANARILPWRVAPQFRQQGHLPDPYQVWLSEIMLQQTTVAAVQHYFLRFTALWPDVQSLAAAPLDAILSEWAGLGYYARARNLHKCAQLIVAEYEGCFPKSADDLQQLPGIGPYTSAAIAAICHDQPIAVLDGNVDRVMARFLALEKPVRDEKPLIRQKVQEVVPQRAGDFAQAMMDLGATICAPRVANCSICPIIEGCRASSQGDPTRFPVKPPKKNRPTRLGHAYVMQRENNDVLLQRRPEKGLLAQMTGVPGSIWSEDRARRTEKNSSLTKIQNIPDSDLQSYRVFAAISFALVAVFLREFPNHTAPRL